MQLLLAEGKSWSQVQELLGCSRSTIAAVNKSTSTPPSNRKNDTVTD
ncbi:helix-turn-helix domain containing protein [Vibrio parahaemolyticus]|nr:helix-turn-helix domain containing protein [Vibrio parahaemolyticus]